MARRSINAGQKAFLEDIGLSVNVHEIPLDIPADNSHITQITPKQEIAMSTMREVFYSIEFDADGDKYLFGYSTLWGPYDLVVGAIESVADRTIEDHDDSLVLNGRELVVLWDTIRDFKPLEAGSSTLIAQLYLILYKLVKDNCDEVRLTFRQTGDGEVWNVNEQAKSGELFYD